MVITYHKNFIKYSKKLTVNQKKKLTKRLQLFGIDQFNPILNNHPLKGKYKGHRSINITGDLRALYKATSKTIVFIIIDNHSNLYR